MQFEGPVVEWRGPAPFYFVAIPAEESADIKSPPRVQFDPRRAANPSRGGLVERRASVDEVSATGKRTAWTCSSAPCCGVIRGVASWVTEEVGGVSEGVWVGFLTVLVLVLVAVVQTVAYWNIGGWLDVRSSETAEEVRKNIEEYGPEVPGLKLNLLPEPERQDVLEARARLAKERAARKAAKH